MNNNCHCICRECIQNHENGGGCYMCKSCTGARNVCIDKRHVEAYKIPDKLFHPQAHIFFDIDGVLSEHRYKDCVFGNGSDHYLPMETYLFGRVFSSNRPICAMQKLIEALNQEHVYVLGHMVCNQELEEKQYWLANNFPVIQREHCFFIAEGRKKSDFLEAWAHYHDIKHEDIVIIDDKHVILHHCEEKGFTAYHPSSLIM